MLNLILVLSLDSLCPSPDFCHSTDNDIALLHSPTVSPLLNCQLYALWVFFSQHPAQVLAGMCAEFPGLEFQGSLRILIYILSVTKSTGSLCLVFLDVVPSLLLLSLRPDSCTLYDCDIPILVSLL